MRLYFSLFSITKLNDPKESISVESLADNTSSSEKNTTKEAEEKEASLTLDVSDKMSSKFAEVGRSIILALIAGSWLLLRFNEKVQDKTVYLIKAALVLAFIYLLIDLIYYCYTMRAYWKFVEFDEENTTIFVKNKNKAFTKQKNIKRCFMNLSIFKAIILFLSIFSICLFVFLCPMSNS